MQNTRPFIVWDWNGTLLSDVSAAVAAINKMLSLRNLPPCPREKYLAHFGFPVRPFYSMLGMDPDTEWDRICTEFHTFLYEPPQDLRPDATAALEYVLSRGAGQSILSALKQDLLDRQTDSFSVRRYFSEIYGTGNLDGASKLERGRELASLLDSRGDTGPRFFIGDTLHDAEVGRAIGAAPILVAGGHQSPERLASAGCAVAPSLLDAVRLALAP